MPCPEKPNRLTVTGCFVSGVVLAAASVLPGCSSRPMVRPEPEPVVLPDEAPADFTLSVTVLAPATESVEVASLPRALRPGRYIVGPDGLLRAAVGPGSTPRVFPRQTRQLDELQRQRLWRVVANTGLLDGVTLTAIDNTETFFPNRTRPTALVYVRQWGAGSHFAVRLPVGDAESPEVVRLLDELAELAWIPE